MRVCVCGSLQIDLFGSRFEFLRQDEHDRSFTGRIIAAAGEELVIAADTRADLHVSRDVCVCGIQTVGLLPVCECAVCVSCLALCVHVLVLYVALAIIPIECVCLPFCSIA